METFFFFTSATKYVHVGCTYIWTKCFRVKSDTELTRLCSEVEERELGKHTTPTHKKVILLSMLAVSNSFWFSSRIQPN